MNKSSALLRAASRVSQQAVRYESSMVTAKPGVKPEGEGPWGPPGMRSYNHKGCTEGNVMDFYPLYGSHLPKGWKTLEELAIENKCHMKFWPVPKGDHAEYWAMKNKQYWLALIRGFGVFVVGFSWAMWEGAMDLAWEPPRKNPPPASWFNEDGSWKVMEYDRAEMDAVLSNYQMYEAGEKVPYP